MSVRALRFRFKSFAPHAHERPEYWEAVFELLNRHGAKEGAWLVPCDLVEAIRPMPALFALIQSGALQRACECHYRLTEPWRLAA